MRFSLHSLVEALSAYFTAQRRVAAAYLYGSYAKGTFKDDSDVDVAVLLKDGNPKVSREIKDRFYLDVSRKLRKDVHLTLLDLNSLDLVRQVLDTGICVCENDPRFHIKFKERAILEIAEFGYYREMFQRATIDRVMEGAVYD